MRSDGRAVWSAPDEAGPMTGPHEGRNRRCNMINRRTWQNAFSTAFARFLTRRWHECRGKAYKAWKARFL